MKEVALLESVNTTPEVVFKNCSVYKTTTTTKKNSKGIWYFEGKVFYQSNNIRAQVFVSGSTMMNLLNKMKHEMLRLEGKL